MGLNIHTNLFGLPPAHGAMIEASDHHLRSTRAAQAVALAHASRSEILRHPGLAILAQANSLPAHAASLLLDT